MRGFLDFDVSFDSCITATLTLLFSITTPSSIGLLPIPLPWSCRTLNVLSSLDGVEVGGGEGICGDVEHESQAHSLLLRY